MHQNHVIEQNIFFIRETNSLTLNSEMETSNFWNKEHSIASYQNWSLSGWDLFALWDSIWEKMDGIARLWACVSVFGVYVCAHRGRKKTLLYPLQPFSQRGLKPLSKAWPVIHGAPRILRKRLLQMLGGMTAQWK